MAQQEGDARPGSVGHPIVRETVVGAGLCRTMCLLALLVDGAASQATSCAVDAIKEAPMSIMSWLLGSQRNSQPGVFFVGKGDYGFEVVGESNYQDALSTICGGPCEEGHYHECIARLIPKPSNAFDKNAVMVVIENRKVAYLPRDDAKRYLRELARLGLTGGSASCKAVIKGGWDSDECGKGHFGVDLDLSMPLRLADPRPRQR
jgi:hypothetical protein